MIRKRLLLEHVDNRVLMGNIACSQAYATTELAVKAAASGAAKRISARSA